MNAVADGLAILVRAALSLILALALVALAVYAATEHVGRVLGPDRLKSKSGDRMHEAAQR
jgi:hypothetical protein